MSCPKIKNKTLNCAKVLLLSSEILLTVALGCNSPMKTRSFAEREGLIMPLFVVKEAEFVDVMKYLAYSAVPIGDNVYFNVKDRKDYILYEIGEKNDMNFVANPQPTGIKISLEYTNISVRTAVQLVANSCGMRYEFTNGVMQLRAVKVPVKTDFSNDAKSNKSP